MTINELIARMEQLLSDLQDTASTGSAAGASQAEGHTGGGKPLANAEDAVPPGHTGGGKPAAANTDEARLALLTWQLVDAIEGHTGGGKPGPQTADPEVAVLLWRLVGETQALLKASGRFDPGQSTYGHTGGGKH